VVQFRPDLGRGEATMELAGIESPGLANVPYQLYSPHLSIALNNELSGYTDIPDGFDYRIDGTLEYFIQTSVESRTFGQVKALYR
jgi:hypothetical protein